MLRPPTLEHQFNTEIVSSVPAVNNRALVGKRELDINIVDDGTKETATVDSLAVRRMATEPNG